MKNKIIKALIVLVFSVLVVSCGSSEKDEANIYFYNINNEISKIAGQPEKIKALQVREQKKYENTGDRKYQISSRYVELFYNYNNSNQIPVVYELLMLNNNEYDYITIASNFNLAFQFEQQSPKLAMRFLNEAIMVDEKSSKKYFLPHLYHLKGRLFFNNENYSQALIFFNKSLQSLEKTRHNLIFISSMHNNFALTYEKMARFDLALKEAKEAVKILENGSNLNSEETSFLASVKGNVGFYYYKIKDFHEAERLLLQELDFQRRNKKNNHDTVDNLTKLFDLYGETNQIDKMKEIMDYSQSIEPEIKDVSDKILISEMVQGYYLKINDPGMVKTFCRKLIKLHNRHEEESNQKLTYISDVLNNFTIKSINQKHQYTIEKQKFKNRLMLTAICIVLIIFGVTIYIIRNISKRDKELASKEKIILMKNKKILEQDLKRQEEKITNLHLNLNLKIETEKTFLENIKKMKKLKNVDAEQVITDLFLKINNLIQIDRKNYDLINESSQENKQFIQKLSERFPSLTNNELKFCVYYKLDFSSKEISLLENITEGSARVYKTKIKTKMNIGKESILNTFLKSI
ncbi:tetratricopeptide repeat protein [Chryseobacterium sp. OSA05B]|uniref:transcriptional regulator n=1 Tax=Chryseobacterium sp. OSA05B TaxID=2862650 RepID=UPI001CBF1490|nr:tetratricopeptide repeat protein [Chryseobacterium sp. OSA05B]